ncbi:MAG TPA: glycosyltransferase family A protein [Flavobacterium sp.]|uniref:glycosyltransferase family 2 protein n=1 Tax=unclassified Flavobacterium TaxID=196869 RepID=UPI0025BD8169|nr:MULTISPECIES: glycosyltransferase family A protein [unclassified Flavobacterium]HRE77009.1 glycosyltransferase family A protein [Flavobacterium sp.]
MLSILIPIYNNTVFELVQNIHQQCMNCSIEFEIICLDDNSVNQFQLENPKIKKLTHCFYSENETNFGRTKTRQILAEKAKFDWVLFLDADVIPETENFIKNYISSINETNAVIFGGYKYEKKQPESPTTLRYKYGKEREEKSPEFRSKKPYQYVFSGNMMIQKKLFLELNYDEKEKFYGMDIYFAYQLFLRKISIHHIDNSIFHLGLETNEVFFEKSLQSVVSRKRLLADKIDIEQLNPLLSHYKKIKKYRLILATKIIFNIFEQFLKRNILSKNPNLFYFDLYRLGYICSVK